MRINIAEVGQTSLRVSANVAGASSPPLCRPAAHHRLEWSGVMADGRFSITVRGLNEEAGQTLAHLIGSVMKRLIEGGLDLSLLEEIIVDPDYATALREVEEKSGIDSPRAYTKEDYAVGVAMALPVKREGGLRTVMVLHAGAMCELLSDDDERRDGALGILFHESAHVADQAVRQRIWAEYISKPAPFEGAEARFWSLADSLIMEYYACRVAASVDPGHALDLAESLREQLPKAKATIDAAIKEYRVGGDLDALIELAERHHGYIIKTCAYLMGSLDGLEKAVDEVLPGLRAEIESSYVGPVWSNLETELRKLFDSYPDWPSPEVHRPLMAVVDAFHRSAGFVFRTVNGKCRVDIPERPENTPSFFEALEIRGRLAHARLLAAAAGNLPRPAAG